ncbi:MAG: DUF4364 family protein [Clostridia bacterium]|nr:DUF4364 family protein [Clostridia bacterium]
MKLTQDGEVLAENKVLILYILNKMKKPISNDNLLKLVLSVMDMNYFYFQQFLLDLIDNQYIVTFLEDNKNVYQITDLGKETLKLTSDMLPGIMKLKVDTNFKEELKASKEENSISAEFIAKGENDYTVTCKINEDNTTIFEVKVFAGSREEAKRIVDNWKENAYRIYPEILNSLNN